MKASGELYRGTAYICAPIRGIRDSQACYTAIKKALEKAGFEILDPWVVEGKELSKNPREIFERDVALLRSAELVVAEVSMPSLGVGMELMLAKELGKRVIICYRKGAEVSLMVLGAGFEEIAYKDSEDLERKLFNKITS